jgi:acyl-CoA dehydrogenase
MGKCHRAFDMLCDYSLSREVFGSTLAQKQTVQNWIADSYTEIQSTRLLVLQTAWKIQRDGDDATRTDISAIKVPGGQGPPRRHRPGAAGSRCARVLVGPAAGGDVSGSRNARIIDGPDEVHRVTVARRVLKGYRPAAVPSQHVPTRRAAARERFAAPLTAMTADG